MSNTKLNLGLFVISLIFIFGCQPKQPNSDLEVWEALFNGKDLSGWTPKFKALPVGENYLNTFRVEDGLLKVSYEQYDTFTNQFGHLFHEKKLSHYKIKARYRFIGEQPPGGQAWAYRNNGLMLHSQDPKTMTHEQEFPLSLEFQLLGGNGKDERTNGNLCTPGCDVYIDGKFTTEHCIDSSSKTYHGDDWVDVEAVVYGDSSFHHIIEGDTVLSYTKATVGGWLPHLDTLQFVSGTPWGEGLISIQAESHNIDFESITVLDLCGCSDPKAKNFKSYFVKADNSSCLY